MKKLTIIGNTLSVAITAAELSFQLKGIVEIDVLTLSNLPNVQSMPVETLSPSFVEFHRRLGISEKQVMNAASATFNLGTRVVNNVEKGYDFFLSLGNIGVDFNNIPFHQYYAMRPEPKPRFDEYCLSTHMAMHHKFVHPSSDHRSVLSTLVYGLNVDTLKYRDLLKSYSQHMGVNWRVVESITPILNDKDRITLLVDGTRCDADLFIDCSHDAMVFSALADHTWQDFTHRVPLNTALTCTTERFTSLQSVNSIQACNAGFMLSYDLQNRAEHMLWTHDNFCDIETATDTLRHALNTNSLSNVSVIKKSQGYIANSWQKNCVAIGPMATSMTPLLLGEAHLTHSAVLRLIDLLPSQSNTQYCRREFSRLTVEECIHLGDFHSLLFRYTQGYANKFWEHARNIDSSTNNQHRISLFQHSAKIARFELDSMSQSMWASQLYGLGVRPTGMQHHIDRYIDVDYAQKMQAMRTLFTEKIAQLPHHDQYLHQYLSGQ